MAVEVFVEERRLYVVRCAACNKARGSHKHWLPYWAPAEASRPSNQLGWLTSRGFPK